MPSKHALCLTVIHDIWRFLSFDEKALQYSQCTQNSNWCRRLRACFCESV